MAGWLIASGLVAVALSAVLFALSRVRVGRQRALMTAAFSRYLAQDAIDELLAKPFRPLIKPERRLVSFVVIQVQDDDIGDIQRKIERAIPILIEADAMIEHLVSSLVIATFGTFPRKDAGAVSDGGALAAGRVMSELGMEARLVYGTGPALVGLIGTGRTMRYGSILPNMVQILERLLQLEFGQSAEISPALN